MPATEPPIFRIDGVRGTGKTLTAVPLSGYSFTAGQWGRRLPTEAAFAPIANSTQLTYSQVESDDPYLLNFLPTNPVKWGGAELPPGPPIITLAPRLNANVAGAAVTWDNGASNGTNTHMLLRNGVPTTSVASTFAGAKADDELVVQMVATRPDGQKTRVSSNRVLVTAAPALGVPLLTRMIRAGYDSRSTSLSEDVTNEIRKVTSTGYAAWFNAEMDYRMEITSNYGLNGDTTAGFNNRLTGNGKGSAGEYVNKGVTQGTSPTWRAEVLSSAFGGSIPITFFLGGGMNDGTYVPDGEGWPAAAFFSGVVPGATLGEQIDNTLKRLIDDENGTGIVILPNGTPSHNVNGLGPYIHARRRYIGGWPQTSLAMSAADKAKYGARVIRVDSWSALAESEDGYNAKSPRYMIAEAGDAIDLAHMSGIGNRLLGEAKAGVMKPLAIAQGLPRRNQLPYVEADSFVGGARMTGATAINMADLDGQNGLMFSGELPTGWTIYRSGSLSTHLAAANNPLPNGEKINVVCSKVQVLNEDGVTYSDGVRIRIVSATGITNPQTHTINLRHNQGIRAVGFAPTASNVPQDNMNPAAPGKVIATGMKLRGIARLKFAADPKGMLGPGLQMNFGGTLQGVNGGQVATHTGTFAVHGHRLDDMPAYDKAIMTPPQVITQAFMDDNPTLRSVYRQLEISMAANRPINIDITISNFGIVERD